MIFKSVEDVIEAQEDGSGPIREQTVEGRAVLGVNRLVRGALQDLDLCNIGVFILASLLEILHAEVSIDEEPAVTPLWQSQSDTC